MKSFRIFALSLVALMFTIILAACGGGGKTPPAPPAPLTITTQLMPLASVNVAYNFVFNADGGVGSYTWELKSPIPPGMTFDKNHGQLIGTPTQMGVYTLTPQVTDSNGTVASKDLTFTVEGVLLITCNSCAAGTAELPYGNPGVAYSATLSATGGKAPLSWCVIENDGHCGTGIGGGLPPGLTISTVGNNGVISGIPTTTGTPKPVTVQVSDSETIVSRGTINLTLTIIDFGPKTLPNATLNTPYNENVTASGGIAPFTWTVTGSLPPGLSLATCVRSQHPSCAITGTPTQVGTSTFTLTVTDGETAPASATADVSITVGPLATNATLNGDYAIALSGYKSGSLYLMVGSIITNGNGGVVSGKLDINDGSGEHNDPSQCIGNLICPIAETIQASSSSYDLSSGTGLGTMTLSTLDYAGNPHTYQFDISVSSTGTSCKPDPNHALTSCGRVIESDSQMYGSGVLKVQNPADFPKSVFFPGNFAMGGTGVDPSGDRYAAAGAVATNPTTGNDIDCNHNGWGLDSCPLDTNDNGNGGSGTTVPNPFKGTFSSTIDTTTGRGEYVVLTFPNDPQGFCPGGLGNPNCGYVYYVVNKQEAIMMSTDPVSKPANLTLWSLERQKSNGLGWRIDTSVASANIMELSANDAGKADVTVGILTSDGTGNTTFASDENDGGTLNQQPPADSTIALGTNGNKTGQFILGASPQFGNGGAVMYMWNGPSGNPGFVVGTDAKVTAGVMEPQIKGLGISNGSVSGNYAGGTVSPVLAAIINSVTYLHADGSGHGVGLQYTSGSGGDNGPTNLTLTYQVDSTGRGVVLDSGGNPYGFLYVVSPSKFAMVPTGTTPALNVFVVGQPD